MLKNEYMKRYNKGIICLLAGAAMFAACQDDWDAHYDLNGSVPRVSLMDLLHNDASLSTFTQIVEEVGVDSLLVRLSPLHLTNVSRWLNDAQGKIAGQITPGRVIDALMTRLYLLIAEASGRQV